MASSSPFTIGCDPEIFLRDSNGKGRSSFGLIPGTKSEPHKTEGGAVQNDGMACEFNTDPVPLNDFEGFNALIVKQIKNIRNIIPKELSLSIVPVMDFDKEHLDAQPDEAKELGCDPDYNAYTMEQNPRPDGDAVLFRSGAGHIHVGWGSDIPVDNEEHRAICASFIKQLDMTVGLFMTFIDREPRRRELYGKAGAFRPKPYGVEYRTPSNAWIINKDRRRLVSYLVQKAVENAKTNRTPETYLGITESRLLKIINEGDYEAAKVFIPNMLPVYNSTLKVCWDKVVKDVENSK